MTNGGEGIKIWWGEGNLLGGFFQVGGNERIFGWWVGKWGSGKTLSMQGMLAHEHITMQLTFPREHIRHAIKQTFQEQKHVSPDCKEHWRPCLILLQYNNFAVCQLVTNCHYPFLNKLLFFTRFLF